MKPLIVASLLTVVVNLTTVSVSAQTVSFPMPGAVVKDADGKVVAQVAGFRDNEDPWVLIADGVVPGLFLVKPYGLDPEGGQAVYFFGLGCTGQSYMSPPLNVGIESLTRRNFAIIGPDEALGTYKMYRSSGTIPQSVVTMSYRMANMPCQDSTETNVVLLAEEIAPNPLEGFHGPTAANPERIWTIEGGDRIQ